MRTKASIIGSGNIGTDVMIKILRPGIALDLVSGRGSALVATEVGS